MTLHFRFAKRANSSNQNHFDFTTTHKLEGAT